ncbi:hypothetical protein EON65_47870 [archaeon]|nr:MAG: hypothetical protein EON65_47870 [archaeon]
MLPSDVEELKAHHQFVRDDEYDAKLLSESWQTRMARRYYDQLYKEYAIIDLSRAELGQIGLRWRTKEEVVSGKGQSYCSNKRCDNAHDLGTYELPFKYVEHEEEKLELVKVRLCVSCSALLTTYHEKKKKSIEPKRKENEGSTDKQERKNKRHKLK